MRRIRKLALCIILVAIFVGGIVILVLRNFSKNYREFVVTIAVGALIKYEQDSVTNVITEASPQAVTAVSLLVGDPRLQSLSSDTLSTTSYFKTDACDQAFKSWFIAHGTTSPETSQYISNACETSVICGPGVLEGSIPVDRSVVDLRVLERSRSSLVNIGGWWSPHRCAPRRHVAVIISYRNRAEHLPILMRHLLPILKSKGDVHFRVFLVEQVDGNTFNKGKLYNIGFKESQKFFPYDCYIFHDLDLLVESDNIPLACEKSPMHLSVAIDRYGYKLSYWSLVGGVLMMSREDVEKVNGYSNSFWFWGCEDDNMFSRLTENKLRLERPSVNIARYQQLVHVKRQDAEGRHTTHDFMRKSFKHTKTDGLNSLQYRLANITEEVLFTHIRVDLQKEKDRLFGTLEYFTNRTES